LAGAKINMSNNNVIEAQSLTKKYGKFVAVDNINLSIAEGEVFGFLGPNGAGKTTTILMLMGFSEPSSGSIKITGCNPAREPIKVKKVVGYMPERVGFYDDLTARENLRYTGRLNGIEPKRLNGVIDSCWKMLV
jgi:ABC-2 type transport system ATP-binding protein